jgi:hypothetical protein
MAHADSRTTLSLPCNVHLDDVWPRVAAKMREREAGRRNPQDAPAPSCSAGRPGEGPSRGYKLRPVEAVQTWLAAAEISSGPVFRAVARGGRVSCESLVDDSAARIVKRYAQCVGLDAASYAGHSLRNGFLTSAAEGGASIWKLSEVSRHKSLDTLRGYVRRVDLFKEHAGASFL